MALTIFDSLSEMQSEKLLFHLLKISRIKKKISVEVYFLLNYLKV